MKDNNEDSDLPRITGKRKISDEENSQPETTLYPSRITPSIDPSPRTEQQTSMIRPQINHRTGLPYGYRFQPTDIELVLKYLIPKVANPHFRAPEITEADIYAFHPQELLERNPERHAFYFTPTQKVSEKGTRTKRTVGGNSGVWKNSGTKPIEGLPGTVIAYKNSFTFYNGKSKKTGDKTEWLMKEFVLNQGNDETSMMNKDDDWVLCHLYDSKFYKDAAASVGGDDVLLREEVITEGLNTQSTVEGEKSLRYLGNQSDSIPQPLFRNDTAHNANTKLILGTTASTSSNVTTTAGTSTATMFFSIINPAVPHQGHQQQLVSASNSGDNDTDGSINTDLTLGTTASTSSSVTTTASTSSATMSVSATQAVPSHPGQQQQQKLMSKSGDNCITEVEVRGNVEAREQMLIGSPEPNTKLSL